MNKVTNNDTIAAYDNGVRAYFDLSPQAVSSHIKDWIDYSLKDLSFDASLIEIGSGTGKDANYITSLGYNLETTDASQGFVDYLNKNGIKSTQFNILTDEFKSKYDLVFADAVLLHFTHDQLKGIISKIRSALAAKGRLAFTVKQGKGEFTEKEKLGMVRYFHLWQATQLKDLLVEAGFELKYCKVAKDNRGNKPGWIMIVAEKKGRP